MSAFQATYSDWRLVRSRKVVQIVLEVPLEAADQAYAVLGGMPNPGSETWVGVARINPAHTRAEEPPESPGAAREGARESVRATEPAPDVGRPARAKRKFEEMPPAAQAGMLCNEESFRRYLRECGNGPVEDKDTAASVVRWICMVDSRSDISNDNRNWPALVRGYRAWMREPAVV